MSRSNCKVRGSIGDIKLHYESLEAANSCYQQEDADDPILVDPSVWNRHEAKLLRAIGVPYFNAKGELRPGRKRIDNCGCKKNCLQQFTASELEEAYTEFNNLANKQLQDDYVTQMIVPRIVQRRRSAYVGTSDQDTGSLQKTRLRQVSYEYYLQVASHKERVCFSAICSAFGIKPNRLKRVASHLQIPSKNTEMSNLTGGKSRRGRSKLEPLLPTDHDLKQSQSNQPTETKMKSTDCLLNYLRDMPMM